MQVENAKRTCFCGRRKRLNWRINTEFDSLGGGSLTITTEQALAQSAAEMADRAAQAVERGLIALLEQGEGYAVLRIYAPDSALVTLTEGERWACDCGEAAPCAHILAGIRYARGQGLLEAARTAWSDRQGEKLLHALASGSLQAQPLRLGVGLKVYDDGRLGLVLSAGRERLYAVQHPVQLAQAFGRGESYVVSPKLTIEPETMRFTETDARLLTLLYALLPIGDEKPEQEGRVWLLPDAPRRMLLTLLETRPFTLMTSDERIAHGAVTSGELPLSFRVSLGAGAVEVAASVGERLCLLTQDARYVLCGERVLHLSETQARVARLLPPGGESAAFRFPCADPAAALTSLLPELSALGSVTPSQALRTRLVSLPLTARVYLDMQGGDVVADVSLHYGDTEIHPFGGASEMTSQDADAPILLRDGKAEGALLQFLSSAGFSMRRGRVALHSAREILALCLTGVAELGKLCEVYVSPAFERIKPRRFGGVPSFHMKGGSLVFTLLEEHQAVEELRPILEAVAKRQQYVRLKTGEFLDVRDLTALSPVAQELLDAAASDRRAEGDERELAFGAYRAGYLVRMLELAGAKPDVDGEVKGAISALGAGNSSAMAQVPSPLLKRLVSYQRRGVGWLLSMYDARMGGILADEMGLGKTVQVIAALGAARRRDGVQKSLIVTPTSLLYHWQAEFKRFDDQQTVRLICGAREDRRLALKEALADESVDVLLTTYPLLRRDIELYQPVPLRFVILDEAQSIKNAASQGASAAKELQAQCRMALSGTPMENHTGELWSLFDFVLPGYLGTQGAFLRRYGGGEHAEELQERIRPFLMRRLKKEVLTNLPEKREHALYAAMTPEQRRVYDQLMETLRLHVGEALRQGALPRARMQVLSLLLKLRQVCCHPRLFLPDYEGTSGKLELLVESVHQAVAGKRRMLIFSQFVGMLSLIRKRLNREGIKTLYLDGDTRPQDRQMLCDRFNGGDGQVFLISLKAGGTGLNLTGADLVIHYDPWWNPAAEDQATDRAHRIGQTRDVDVVKLITQDSIEEKVAQLSAKKRAIFDRVVLAGETALGSLSEADIRALFLS